jgi:hypothetical protein
MVEDLLLTISFFVFFLMSIVDVVGAMVCIEEFYGNRE